MQIEDLSYKFPKADQPLFEHLNLTLADQQVNFLIGPNGAGKTTLADILVGLRPVAGVNPQKSAIYLNQQLPMLAATRVCDVAKLVLGVATGRLQLSLTTLATLVDAPTLAFLTPRWHRHYGDLSGGERKLVQLLLFLQVDRKLVVLDEPTAFVDRQHVSTLFTVIRNHPDRTYLMITHDVRDITAFTQYQVLWLSERQIKATWNAEQFTTHTNDADFLQAFKTI